MALTTKLYGGFWISLGNKLIDLDSDSIKVMLMASYTPNVDTHRFVSDAKAVGTEATGTGYTAGGKTVGTVTLSSSSSGVVTVSIADVAWSGSTISAVAAIFYDATPGTDATNPLIGYWDFGTTVTTTNGPFTLDVAAAGFFTMTSV